LVKRLSFYNAIYYGWLISFDLPSVIFKKVYTAFLQYKLFSFQALPDGHFKESISASRNGYCVKEYYHGQ